MFALEMTGRIEIPIMEFWSWVNDTSDTRVGLLGSKIFYDSVFRNVLIGGDASVCPALWTMPLDVLHEWVECYLPQGSTENAQNNAPLAYFFGLPFFTSEKVTAEFMASNLWGSGELSSSMRCWIDETDAEVRSYSIDHPVFSLQRSERSYEF